MNVRRATSVRLLFAALTVLCAAGGASAQRQAFGLREPVSFHGARIIGFERGVGLKSATALIRPSDPSLVFITLKLELAGPFEYEPGRFRELTLTDENDHVYSYRGWLTDDGWINIDDPKVEAVGPMEAQDYPAVLDLHFEVPENIRTLVLHFGPLSRTLFSRPQR